MSSYGLDNNHSSRNQWVDVETKATQAWGEKQAQSLWHNLYERYHPVIDGQTVLDLGCSWGYLLRFLAETFRPKLLIGTDIKPWWDIHQHGWDYRSLGSRLQFHAGNLSELEAIPDESVDLILSTSVLQYMTPEQVEANLSRAYKVLRPGREMLLRTRVFTSYLGADLHRDIDLPYVHLLYGEPDIVRHLTAPQGKHLPYLNWLTASSYLAIFVRVGFEVLDVRRRPNKVAPDVMERVQKAYPWVSANELLCAELEARLIRPIEPEELNQFGKFVSTGLEGPP